jgi:hypothetical protein
MEWIVALLCLVLAVVIVRVAVSDIILSKHFPTISTLLGLHDAVITAEILGGTAAVIATIVVVLFRTAHGPIEFSALGVKFAGPSGPTLIWTVVFLVQCVAARAFPSVPPSHELAERQRIANFLNATCNHTVLYNPYSWEMRDAAYSSISEIRENVGETLTYFSPNSPAAKPLQRMQLASAHVLTNPRVSPNGGKTPGGPVDERAPGVRLAYEEFRNEFKQDILLLEDDYDLKNQCDLDKLSTH